MSDEQMGGMRSRGGSVLNKLLQVMKTDVEKKVLEKHIFANFK